MRVWTRKIPKCYVFETIDASCTEPKGDRVPLKLLGLGRHTLQYRKEMSSGKIQPCSSTLCFRSL
jgi:hypothetical protein